MGLLSIQDVTDLNKNILKVKQSIKVKEEFFSVCSHDLRSPLNAIIGLSDLLKENICSEDEKLEYANIINDSGYLMIDLINNLLDLTKGNSTSAKDLKEVELDLCLLKSYTIHKHLAKEKNIEMTCKIDASSIVMGIEHEILRVINNLLSNAIKFTPKNGKISLEMQTDGDLVLLKVKDSGIGIEKEKIATLFNKYTKSHRVGTEGEVGTGLGLSIVSQILKRFSGSISVESTSGKGSCFQVEFPQKRS